MADTGRERLRTIACCAVLQEAALVGVLPQAKGTLDVEVIPRPPAVASNK